MHFSWRKIVVDYIVIVGFSIKYQIMQIKVWNEYNSVTKYVIK